MALDGSRVVRTNVQGLRGDAVTIGRRAAGELVTQGADEILTEVRGLAPGGN
jgi:hypothetical protein